MSQPTITIVIPSYNRPESLLRCLQSLEKLDYPKHLWDVIVINDGGETSFSSIDEKTIDIRLQKITIDNSGPATARNHGARQATGEYVAFTDDDCEVMPNWLSIAMSCLNDTSCAIGGKMINAYPNHVAAETWQVYIDFLQTKIRTADNQPILLPSNNIIYHRQTFLDIGGFNETFPLPAAEDFEIGYRIFGHGYRQIFIDEMNVIHHHRATPLAYLSQHYRYGRGAYYMRHILAKNELPHPVTLLPRPKGKFFLDLALHLWNSRAPLMMWILMFLTPIVHFLGRMRETLAPIRAIR